MCAHRKYYQIIVNEQMQSNKTMSPHEHIMIWDVWPQEMWLEWTFISVHWLRCVCTIIQVLINLISVSVSILQLGGGWPLSPGSCEGHLSLYKLFLRYLLSHIYMDFSDLKIIIASMLCHSEETCIRLEILSCKETISCAPCSLFFFRPWCLIGYYHNHLHAPLFAGILDHKTHPR